ncbi:MAG: hypothetical protein ACR2P3_02470 [Geminicoccaceae bacterium]
MVNRFEQSTPPSIHDVYRGLPIGPGGIDSFIYRDRGRHGRAPVRLPWGWMARTLKNAALRVRDLIGLARSKGRNGQGECPAPLVPAPRICS